MSDPFIGEIRMFGFAWPPRDWAVCDGSLLTLSQHQALYSLLGVQFGGNGTTNFALPDMRSRVPMHSDPSAGFEQGVVGGYESVTLNTAHMPHHSHVLRATTDGTGSSTIGDNSVFHTGSEAAYCEADNLVDMNQGMCTSTGGGLAHNNIQPSLGIGFCISLQGLYPSRN